MSDAMHNEEICKNCPSQHFLNKEQIKLVGLVELIAIS